MDYEVDRLERRINAVTDESLAATNRIRRVAEETEQIGVETLGTLHDQGEQLNHIESQVDRIKVDLNDADKHLREIEKCCGCCVCPWNRVRSTTKVKARKQSREDPSVITDQPRHSNNSKGGVSAGGGSGGGYIERVTNDEREDQIDENLDAVASVLGNLKGLAQDMGNELYRQNEQIPRLNDKVQNRDDDILKINKRIQQQLK